MAASTPDRDYVHQLVAKLERQTQSKVELTLVPGIGFEKDLAETGAIQNEVVQGKFDYIVVQIGDNIQFTSSNRSAFKDRYSRLISRFAERLSPNGVFVCVGKWWRDTWVDEQIKSACDFNHGRFVSLDAISGRSGSRASQEREIGNAGVGAHPGDAAMSEIAAQIFVGLTSPEPKVSLQKSIDVGVYYFPGWHSKSRYWKDLEGLPDSRSPHVPWPDREPLLGRYAEEDIKVAEQHIDWASQYGVTFFAYDWYWSGTSTYLNHAIENFLKASNNSKLKFSLLWANHGEVPRSLREFDGMVDYWLMHYLMRPQFYRIDGKPVIFVFSSRQLETNANKFGSSAKVLLKRANSRAHSAGLPGLFFVATVNARPSDAVEEGLVAQGYSAYSGWNYVVSKDGAQRADYQSMVDTYLEFYEAAKGTKGVLPYIVPASPGWDSRPWGGAGVLTRIDPTPEKFRQMLNGAKQLLDSNTPGILDVLMIEAWNEFGEGAYIEPTRKWGFEYLQVINSTFSKTESMH